MVRHTLFWTSTSTVQQDRHEHKTPTLLEPRGGNVPLRGRTMVPPVKPASPMVSPVASTHKNVGSGGQERHNAGESLDVRDRMRSRI